MSGSPGTPTSAEPNAQPTTTTPPSSEPAATPTPAAGDTSGNPVPSAISAGGVSKPGEPVAAEPVAPLTMESFTLPEGFEADPALSTKFVDILNDAKMTPAERGSALIALQSEALKMGADAAQQQFVQMNEDWITAAKADPTIGGDKLAPTLASIGKLVDTFGTPELRGVFDLTGAGNNPEMIKFLGKIANELVTEGGPVQGAPVASSASLAEQMYPSMKKGA